MNDHVTVAQRHTLAHKHVAVSFYILRNTAVDAYVQF